MEERMKLQRWIGCFICGDFDAEDVKTQIKAGWYDWFCKDTSLYNKLKKMGPIICKIKDGGKVDLDKSYVFFKNNCPLCAPLYDQFKICDIESRDVIFCISIDSPWDSKKYAVNCKDYWDKPIAEFNTSRELVGWLNSNA